MNISKSAKVYAAFLFMGHAFWKEPTPNLGYVISMYKVYQYDIHMTYLEHTFSYYVRGRSLICFCYLWHTKKYLKVCLWNKFYIPEKYPKHTTWDIHKTYLTSILKMYDFGMYDIPKTHQWHIKNISYMTYLKHNCWIPETYVWHT